VLIERHCVCSGLASNRRLRLHRQFRFCNFSFTGLLFNLYYSLWYYSLYCSSITLHMQPNRSKHTRAPTAEESFGKVLRELRQERGFTQEDLAFESGFHPTYIGLLERGKKSPSLRTIMRLAAALNTHGSEILRLVETRLKRKSRKLFKDQ